MLVVPHKPETAPPPKPVEPKLQPVVQPAPVVNVTVDTAEVAKSIDEQNSRMEQLVSLMAQAVGSLEAGKSFTVTVTEWNTQGRIKSLKIIKE